MVTYNVDYLRNSQNLQLIKDCYKKYDELNIRIGEYLDNEDETDNNDDEIWSEDGIVSKIRDERDSILDKIIDIEDKDHSIYEDENSDIYDDVFSIVCKDDTITSIDYEFYSVGECLKFFKEHEDENIVIMGDYKHNLSQEEYDYRVKNLPDELESFFNMYPNGVIYLSNIAYEN